MKLFKKKILNNSLRPCAFCGSVAKLVKCGNQKEYLIYQCSHCCVSPVRLHEARVSENRARKIWNQRTEEAEHILKIYKYLLSSTTVFTSSEG